MTLPRRHLVTAALPYSNGRLHIGHIAGAYLPADAYVRFLRACGDDVMFICGSDDNGVAALISARNEGVTVEECTAKYNSRQQADFKSLGIAFDIYGGTHQPGFAETHAKLSQDFFKVIYKAGYFNKKATDQLFDPVAKQFLPDRYVQGTCPVCAYEKAYGDQCENCGESMDPLKLINPRSTISIIDPSFPPVGVKLTPWPGGPVSKAVVPEVRQTTHWYLQLGKLEKPLELWLESKTDWRPTVTKFSLGQLKWTLAFTLADEATFKALQERFTKEAGHATPDGSPPWDSSFAPATGEDPNTRFVFQRPDDADALGKILEGQGIAYKRSGGLPERAMTRDLTWGVSVPLDDPEAKGKSLYVWFDAPIGYVTFTAVLAERRGKPEEVAARWKSPDCRIVHFIGEDNIVFHAITWPAMLMAYNTGAPEGAKFELPSNVVANSFLNYKKDGKPVKIGKATLPADDPAWIVEYFNKGYEADPLRFYLNSIAPEAGRTFFAFEEYIAKNNELADVLGNFYNRTLTFAVKYFEGKVPDAGQRSEADNKQLDERRRTLEAVKADLEGLRFKAAQEKVINLARAGNGYFDSEAPFRTRKENLAAAGRTINVCLQTARTLTALIAPFLPTTADRVLPQLGLDSASLKWDKALDELPAGHPLGTPQILFKKLDAAGKPIEAKAKPPA